MAKELVVGEYYQPNVSQKVFHSSKAKYPLLHGSRGGGKTLAQLWEFLRKCHEVPGSNNILLRRTLTASEKGGIEDHLVKYIPKGMYTDYNKTKHIVTVHPKQGGESKLFFGHIKADVDLVQYQGPEYLNIGWEELTQFTYPMWSYMKGSNRCPVKQDVYGNKPVARMTAGTNPNGIGSHWVKALWIQKKLPSGVEDATYNPDDYDAIFSSYEHNSVYANDAEYINNLASLPPNLRAAWLEGSWDILSGQFFSNFELDRHVLGTAEIAIPDWQPRWISIDWGFVHATCVLWWAQAEISDRLTGKKRNAIVAYRCMVRRNTNERALGEAIIGASTDPISRKVEPVANVFLSPDRFNRQNEEHTIADRLGDVLAAAGIPRPERANNDRVGGWRLCYTLLDTEGIVVSEACKDLIDSIPQLMRDEKDLEDAASEGNELYLDVCESFRYGIMSHFNPRKKPQHIVDDEVIRAIPDPTWKMLEYLRQQARPAVNELTVNVPQRIPPWRRQAS